MKDTLTFPDRNTFRNWLTENGENSGGVWLLFGKKGGPITLSANDALEEALCFGWIDGQMQSLNEKEYKKYFAPCRANSKWSEKNKSLVAQLEMRGIMTDFGRAKIAEAKANGQWDKPKAPPENDEQVAVLSDILKEYEPAFTNFTAMSPSVKRTYTRAFLDAKTDAGRKKRLAWIVERLNNNLKPM
jgi:uncharacterized protein YdeI (YjbR/CyaY-like superfamily)